MGAFKKIDRQDVYLTTVEAQKSWTVNYASFLDEGIKVYTADKNSTEEAERSYYDSLEQLYFREYVNGVLESGSMYEHYVQSSIERSNTRILADRALIISIPSIKVGDYIVPGTVELATESETIQDDGEGTLIEVGTEEVLGYVNYSHGLVVIASSRYFNLNIETLKWESSHTIYTYNVHCRVQDYEFNYTLNPTSTTQDGTLYENFTNKEFNPYITTVGLYNSANELIAVGKLAQPFPKTPSTETSFIVQIDV